MSKIIYFNDTGREVRLHPANKYHIRGDMSPIKNLEAREFEYDDGCVPMIKQWSDGTILIMVFSKKEEEI